MAVLAERIAMPTVLTMLIYSTVLLLVLVIIQTVAGLRAQGVSPMVGPRDDLPPPRPFQARTKRIVDNHREGLTMFAPLAATAAILHSPSIWIGVGAQIFFYSRVVHAVIYLLGLPHIRPIPWMTGLIGTAAVFLGIIGLI
jgi:uncharacterized MAPEG superfamily protein